MNEKIRLLQSEIRSDLEDIAQAYEKLNQFAGRLDEPEMAIVVAYYLHVIYGLFENILKRISTLFGNRITDQSRWHTQLLHQMTLDVPEIRPAVIGHELYDSLDELRRFRHLFRNAYVLSFDPDHLAIALKRAYRVETLYRRDIEKFLQFLDALAENTT